jgi:hypothetical protein
VTEILDVENEIGRAPSAYVLFYIRQDIKELHQQRNSCLKDVLLQQLHNSLSIGENISTAIVPEEKEDSKKNGHRKINVSYERNSNENSSLRRQTGGISHMFSREKHPSLSLAKSVKKKSETVNESKENEDELEEDDKSVEEPSSTSGCFIS